MTDLTDFLLARIAEDEAVASVATPGPWSQHTAEAAADTVVFAGREWITNVENCPAVGAHMRTPGGSICQDQAIPNGVHIARHDPARVLAECDAKRRIVWAYDPREDGDYTLRALAAVYADHPDYREGWVL